MPSDQAFMTLEKAGIDLVSDEGFRFNKYDSLATIDDLNCLFEVLYSVRDSTGRPAVMTPVSVVANPDFEKIKESDYEEYHYEPFTETLKRYPGCENSFVLWKEGICNRLFVPQFHGREHLNVKAWLRALRDANKNITFAFDNHMWGISTANDPQIGIELQAAYDFIIPADIEFHKEVITTGLSLFEQLFGYKASYFVPPNGPFSSVLEPVCAEGGIRYLMVSKIQTEPLGYGRTKKRIHWLGKRTADDLIIITRNCFFEPSQYGISWVDSCLKDISIAFRWHKPAIISTHRVNFIGTHDVSNRDKGLKQLSQLLKTIIQNWPDTVFLTSQELGNIISND